ncbi:hypothetical protein Q0F99_01340 [Rathayibacter oskolensis]|uniref:hypothetical protein n=1 Tax=Rathayibacter oskolensis TaxID=1891671 RepID=UPI00265FF7B0|nr:hypothetical protein [Rathayibacter oskolensis]WKK71850.1 hypothetical protein Q0F99_01340 [Rathayibacter oskolensis]
MPSWFSRRGVAVVRPLRLLLRRSPVAVAVTLVLLVASAVTGTLLGPASADTSAWWAGEPARPWAGGRGRRSPRSWSPPIRCSSCSTSSSCSLCSRWPSGGSAPCARSSPSW